MTGGSANLNDHPALSVWGFTGREEGEHAAEREPGHVLFDVDAKADAVAHELGDLEDRQDSR